jgi:hypothetical protein
MVKCTTDIVYRSFLFAISIPAGQTGSVTKSHKEKY